MGESENTEFERHRTEDTISRQSIGERGVWENGERGGAGGHGKIDLELVGQLLRGAGQDASHAAGLPDCGIAVSPDLEAALAQTRPDIAIDFTEPGTALANALAVVKHDARPVIGTTEIPAEGIERLRHAITEKGSAGLVAPNFAIGAVLLMKFAAEAVRYLPDCEIIELHHDGDLRRPAPPFIRPSSLQKAAPRGGWFGRETGQNEKGEFLFPARGVDAAMRIPIHSVRLAGFVAGEPGDLRRVRARPSHSGMIPRTANALCPA